MRISRPVLLLLPTITVMIVMFAIFVAGAPRSYFAARLYGGPTEKVKKLAWRLEAVERLGDKEVSFGSRSVKVRALKNGRGLGEWTGKLDSLGLAEVAITLAEPPSGPLEVSVLDVESGRVLAHDWVSLTQARWQTALRERGGWLPGRSTGAIQIQAAPGRGVFAVPFADPLWVEVYRDGRPLAGASLTLSGDGAEIRAPKLVSDVRGRAVFSVAPLEHFATVSIRAEAPGGAPGELRVSLPVVPGALHAERRDGVIAISSPIARNVAYFSFVDRGARHGGGVVKLVPEGRGGGGGLVRLPVLDQNPLWVVISSEPDLRSPAAVGWPLTLAADGPPRTLDVYDRLLLDGARRAFNREQERLRRVRWVTFALCGVALALSMVLLVARIRSADQGIEAHLESVGLGADAARVAPARNWFIVAALLSVLLGFLVLALVVLYQVQ